MPRFLAFELPAIPDELVDSFIARHIALLRPHAGRMVWAALGRANPGRQVLLPTGLKTLAAELPSEIMDFELLVRGHTAFPIVEPLLSIDRREKLLNALGLPSSDVGNTGFEHKNNNLLYCPACRAEQITRFGSAGWSRVHQLDGVFVCPRHKRPLLRAQFPAFGAEGYGFIAGEAIVSTKVDDPFPPGMAIRVAKLVEFQVSDPSAGLVLRDVPSLVRRLFLEAGLVLGNGAIRNGTREAFREAFGDRALRTAGVPLDTEEASTSWLYGVIGGRRRATPIQLTLMLAFMRVDPTEDQLRPDPVTMPRMGERPNSNLYLAPIPSQWAAMRERILRSVEEGLSRSQLSKREFTAHRTLWKHDRAWMEAHLPDKISNLGNRRYGPDDDEALLARLQAAHSDISAEGGLPVRITATLITERTGLTLVKNNAERLPLCVAFLERHADTLLSFWTKRFGYGVSTLGAIGKSVGWQEFLDHIRFRPERTPDLVADARLAYRRLRRVLAGAGMDREDT